MAKFGIFESNQKEPTQEFEGDEMVQNGDYVGIYKIESAKRIQVGAIKMWQGQCVKKIGN
ncbi:MAG TPA: hypothetical protein VMI93_00855 [Candidatus Solibacter sp.]|nr:hypothetical protein [Candidatus Solibacter sp.]